MVQTFFAYAEEFRWIAPIQSIVSRTVIDYISNILSITKYFKLKINIEKILQL